MPIYNIMRANIRNAMVPMTVSEATDYVDSFDKHDERREYAEEFTRELEAELEEV